MINIVFNHSVLSFHKLFSYYENTVGIQVADTPSWSNSFEQVVAVHIAESSESYTRELYPRVIIGKLNTN